jgi:hypothetical protein
MSQKDPNRYPRGWDRKKVQSVIDYYEQQSDEAAIAEARRAYRKRTTSLIEVPIKLLPQVRKLISRRAG